MSVKTPKEKKLPGGVKFTPDMTTDQRLEHIAERKEYILNKKTRREGLGDWAQKGQFSEKMRDFFIEFHLAKGKAGKKFKISTEFKKKLNVPNPEIDDLHSQLAEEEEKIVEFDGKVLEARKNIADVCECGVEELDGNLGKEIAKNIAKGPPRVTSGPTYVPQHMLAKGWTVMYTADEGKPYYVHIMRQLSQWDPPDKVKEGDPPTPPGTPDPPTNAIDEGWMIRVKERDPWEVMVDSKHWKKGHNGIQGGVPSRATRIAMLFKVMRDDSKDFAKDKEGEDIDDKYAGGQLAATCPNYAAKRKFRHEHPKAVWDENGVLVSCPAKGDPEGDDHFPAYPKVKKEVEPEQKDGEGDEGDGEGDEESDSELDSDVEECIKPAPDFMGVAPKEIFGEDVMKHMPRKMGGPGGKSTRVKFEFPKGNTPEATPPASDAGDDAGGGDGGGGDDDDEEENDLW